MMRQATVFFPADGGISPIVVERESDCVIESMAEPMPWRHTCRTIVLSDFKSAPSQGPVQYTHSPCCPYRSLYPISNQPSANSMISTVPSVALRLVSNRFVFIHFRFQGLFSFSFYLWALISCIDGSFSLLHQNQAWSLARSVCHFEIKLDRSFVRIVCHFNANLR